MTQPATCEVVALPDGVPIVAKALQYSVAEPPNPHKNHFHGLCELIWYRRIKGTCSVEDWRCPLEPQQALFVPSMCRHDFHVEPEDREWIIVQFDPYLSPPVASVSAPPLSPRITEALCVKPDEMQAKRLDTIMAWIVDAYQTNQDIRLTQHLLELALTIVAGSKPVARTRSAEKFPELDKIRPVLELIHGNPSERIPLNEAAAVCNLSPAYFSREFTKLMHVGFTSYQRDHRLQLATHRLLSTKTPISSIGYSLGFASAAHFSSQFNKKFGMSPREYRSSGRITKVAFKEVD